MNNEEQPENSCIYFDISKQERDSAIRYLLGVIINSRRESNFPSNYYTFDEDVNVYLAHLLFAISLPEYHEMAEPYLSLDTSDILQWVRDTEDRTIRYFIFKVNADHMMIHSAVFNDLGRQQSGKFFKKSPKHYRELAKLYYDQASAYHKRIYRKKTGVGEVLEKLSRYYDSYLDVLKNVRREYFNYLNSFRDQAFNVFMQEIKSFEGEYLKKSKMDEFLDLYAKWLETKDPDVEGRLFRLAADLRRIDPKFHFGLSKNSNSDEERPWSDDERKCA